MDSSNNLLNNWSWYTVGDPDGLNQKFSVLSVAQVTLDRNMSFVSHLD